VLMANVLSLFKMKNLHAIPIVSAGWPVLWTHIFGLIWTHPID
jgi:hypothetical protein